MRNEHFAELSPYIKGNGMQTWMKAKHCSRVRKLSSAPADDVNLAGHLSYPSSKEEKSVVKLHPSSSILDGLRRLRSGQSSVSYRLLGVIILVCLGFVPLLEFCIFFIQSGGFHQRSAELREPSAKEEARHASGWQRGKSRILFDLSGHGKATFQVGNDSLVRPLGPLNFVRGEDVASELYLFSAFLRTNWLPAAGAPREERIAVLAAGHVPTISPARRAFAHHWRHFACLLCGPYGVGERSETPPNYSDGHSLDCWITDVDVHYDRKYNHMNRPFSAIQFVCDPPAGTDNLPAYTFPEVSLVTIVPRDFVFSMRGLNSDSSGSLPLHSAPNLTFLKVQRPLERKGGHVSAEGGHISAGGGHLSAGGGVGGEPAFAVCPGPFYRGTSPDNLIEWVTYNLLHGATKIFLYCVGSDRQSLSVDVARVLHYYVSRGIIEIIVWDLPVPGRESPAPGQSMDLWNFGQRVQVMDCYYRASAFADYVLNLDLDEFLAPVEMKASWHAALSPWLHNASVGILRLQTWFHPMEMWRDQGSGLLTQEVLVKVSEPCGVLERTKLIAKTDSSVHYFGIHHPTILPYGVECADIPTSVAYIRHYRYGFFPRNRSGLIQDHSMLHWKDALEKELRERKRSTASLFWALVS